jgi:DNA-binding transcriptional ArsR family regulator
MRRDVFQAIADPTRREIINLIAYQPLNLNTIADNFKVSRPAISQHIKILIECGLIQVNQQGRERYCEATLNELREVANWVEQYRRLWAERFDLMDDLLDAMKADDKKGDKKKKNHKKKKHKK